MIVNAEFIQGASSLQDLPDFDLPEVAIIGRSNVGKSTLLNRITARKKLARVSSTPGRTQELNFFKLTYKVNQEKKDLIVTDLPGYGYAKFSKTKRLSLAKLAVDYIEQRENLQLVLILNDLRRKISDEEIELRDFVFSCDKHYLLVLTKSDKLNQSEKTKALRERAEEFGLEQNDLIVTGDKVDIRGLMERIDQITK